MGAPGPCFGHFGYNGRMRSVTATEAKNQLGQVLEDAISGPVTITKTGRRVAVVLSWSEYERLQALEDDVWAKKASEAEVDGYLGPKQSAEWLKKRLRNR